jgi:hypothetical protein
MCIASREKRVSVYFHSIKSVSIRLACRNRRMASELVALAPRVRAEDPPPSFRDGVYTVAAIFGTAVTGAHTMSDPRMPSPLPLA